MSKRVITQSSDRNIQQRRNEETNDCETAAISYIEHEKVLYNTLRRTIRKTAKGIDNAIKVWEESNPNLAMMGEDAKSLAITFATQASRQTIDLLLSPVHLCPILGDESSLHSVCATEREHARKILEDAIVEASMAVTSFRVMYSMGQTIDYKRMNMDFDPNNISTYSMPIRVLCETLKYQTYRIYGHIAKSAAVKIMYDLRRRKDDVVSDLEDVDFSDDDE